MQVGTGAYTYRWIDNWARTPETESSRTNGRTHGVVVTKAGDVVVFHQADPAVLIFAADGTLQDAWGHGFLSAHGMTLVEEDGTEYLWLTDENSAAVVKTTLDGAIVQSLQKPSHPVYATGRYVPTWIGVAEERYGGNGDIWVADGYGSSYVHRYDRSGRYLQSINGEEGEAGAFRCPHALWVDHRRTEPRLYIADRGNRRIQVYDLEGSFQKACGADILTSPCGFVTYGDWLLIPELRARLTILDGEDHLVGYLGSNEQVCDIPGWPNHESALIREGKFNSPHGMAVDSAGNLFVVEWIIGGRITKLEKITTA